MPDRPPFLNLPSSALSIALVLAAWMTGGCSTGTTASQTSETNFVVSVPHIERMDVSICKGDNTAINRLLSGRAESFAKKIDHGSVWYGEGLSMEPLLEPGSWIVTRPHPYTKLRPGMVVLYTTTAGRQVVHALVRRTSEGWVAVGVNNDETDLEFVTSTNFAGVIAGVFTPARPQP
ncbi:S24/S26 family peptidase [Rariglobus hedericola]|uniref:Peptidase S24/S26A/S26B/S26C domain-containing protein n=1 Tax=Rariglobus hedericola TaxID=2597822 RepID=A0A556QK92_9BACT|nr:S24/S26 family peptidase [Rariglobus hedericola]TSJ77049.1 hypothetical protein FPL22_13170 [Rariglobus hedericola]